MFPSHTDAPYGPLDTQGAAGNTGPPKATVGTLAPQPEGEEPRYPHVDPLLHHGHPSGLTPPQTGCAGCTRCHCRDPSVVGASHAATQVQGAWAVKSSQGEEDGFGKLLDVPTVLHGKKIYLYTQILGMHMCAYTHIHT